jgi:hypothetical protein
MCAPAPSNASAAPSGKAQPSSRNCTLFSASPRRHHSSPNRPHLRGTGEPHRYKGSRRSNVEGVLHTRVKSTESAGREIAPRWRLCAEVPDEQRRNRMEIAPLASSGIQGVTGALPQGHNRCPVGLRAFALTQVLSAAVDGADSGDPDSVDLREVRESDPRLSGRHSRRRRLRRRHRCAGSTSQ